MQLITDEIREQLLANGQDPDGDHVPVVKLFNPAGAGTWLISQMDPEDEDLLFGLCDLGFGEPELGYVAHSELAGYELLPGLGIERDLWWEGAYPLSVYTEIARKHRRIVERPSEEEVRAVRNAGD
mgnify:FL=1